MELASEAARDGPARESAWEGGFRELVRGFLVLRDLFSYTLPGAAFLAIGLSSRSLAANRLLSEIRGGPAWAVILLGFLAGYLAGHILITSYYLPSNMAQIPRLQHLWTKITGREVKAPAYRLSVEELKYRQRVPSLFVELDRFWIISDMRRCLVMALAFGVMVFRWWPDHWGDGMIECLLVVGGSVLYISILSSRVWGRKLTELTLQAASEVLQESERSAATPAQSASGVHAGSA
jgi:hypothetical protein